MDAVTRIYEYPLDLTGKLASNLVSNDIYNLQIYQFPIIVVRQGTFYKDSLIITNMITGETLKEDTDYRIEYQDTDAGLATGKACYTCVNFLNPDTGPSKVSLQYQVVGGVYRNRVNAILTAIHNLSVDSRKVYWKDIEGKPTTYPPSFHTHPLSQVTNFGALIKAIINDSQVTFNCVASMEIRLLSLIRQMDKDNSMEHESFLALLKSIEDYVIIQVNAVESDLKTFMTETTTNLAKKADKTTTVNKYSLASNITLGATDVDAVSATTGGTFKAGFIDDITNYGKVSGIGLITDVTKTKIDSLVAGSMIAITKSATTDALPGEVGDFGFILKYPSYQNSNQVGYVVEYTTSAGIKYLGYANGISSIIWTPLTEAKNMVPVGTISMWPSMSSPSSDHLLLKGGFFNAKEYPDLFKILGTNVIPDFRGVVPRGLDDGRGLDSDTNRTLLSYQADAMKNLTGSFYAVWGVNPVTGVFKGTYGGRTKGKTDGDGQRIDLDISSQIDVANEIRMKNIAINFIIQAK